MLKRILISSLFTFIISSCSNNSSINHCSGLSFKIIGAQTSPHNWIYLCGLMHEFVPEHMKELKALDKIGKQLNIKFLVMIPRKRCPEFNNLLCWPHETKAKLIKTYQKIINATHDYSIQGYVGFSNGGFFLNKLAQFVKIDKPIISIGAGGPLFEKKGPLNTIHLLIGKKDQWHYETAINLHKQSQDANITIHLIESDKGHEIPEQLLKNVIMSSMKL